MKKQESYVFGSLNKPNWFKEECAKGRIKINVDDYGVKTAKISSGTTITEVHIGDEIIKTLNGLSVKRKTERVVKVNEEKDDDIS